MVGAWPNDRALLATTEPTPFQLLFFASSYKTRPKGVKALPCVALRHPIYSSEAQLVPTHKSCILTSVRACTHFHHRTDEPLYPLTSEPDVPTVIVTFHASSDRTYRRLRTSPYVTCSKSAHDRRPWLNPNYGHWHKKWRLFFFYYRLPTSLEGDIQPGN